MTSHLRGRRRKLIREQLRIAFGDICPDCLEPMIFKQYEKYEPKLATIDHKIPLAEGGTHVTENLRLVCFACNKKKGKKLVALP